MSTQLYTTVQVIIVHTQGAFVILTVVGGGKSWGEFASSVAMLEGRGSKATRRD